MLTNQSIIMAPDDWKITVSFVACFNGKAEGSQTSSVVEKAIFEAQEQSRSTTFIGNDF